VAAKVEAESRPLTFPLKIPLHTKSLFRIQIYCFFAHSKALSFHITIDESDIEATMVLVKIQMVFHC